MNLEIAQRYAQTLSQWISPYCERVEIAGSVRRLRGNCNDVDLVVIPKVEEEKDMFGTVVQRRTPLIDFLHSFVQTDMSATWRCVSGTSKEKPAATHNLMLKLKKCDLDIFIATPETFGTVLLCRTGSKEHNIYIAEQARAKGLAWKTMIGIVDADGKVVASETEEQVLKAVGLDFIAPEKRERRL